MLVMIILNLWKDADHDPKSDGIYMELAGVVNDSLAIDAHEIEILETHVYDAMCDVMKEETLYEVYVERGLEPGDPLPERVFRVHHYIEKVQSEGTGAWYTPPLDDHEWITHFKD